MAEYENQHYIPQSYLRRFLSEQKGELWCIDLKTSSTYTNLKPKLRGVRRICSKPNYYTLDKEIFSKNSEFENLQPLDFEKKIFRDIETKLPKLLEYFDAYELANYDNVHNLIESILHIKLRNDSWRNRNRDHTWNDIFAKTAMEILKKDGLPASEINLSNVFNFIQEIWLNNPLDGKELQLAMLKRRNNGDSMIYINNIEKIAYFKWRILNTTICNPFITSDNPGFSISPKTLKLDEHKFVDENIFYFPLSPTSCLEIDSRKSDQKAILGGIKSQHYYKIISRMQATDSEINAINTNTIRMSYNYIIARDKSTLLKYAQEITSLAERRRNP